MTTEDVQISETIQALTPFELRDFAAALIYYQLDYAETCASTPRGQSTVDLATQVAKRAQHRRKFQRVSTEVWLVLLADPVWRFQTIATEALRDRWLTPEEAEDARCSLGWTRWDGPTYAN